MIFLCIMEDLVNVTLREASDAMWDVSLKGSSLTSSVLSLYPSYITYL